MRRVIAVFALAMALSVMSEAASAQFRSMSEGGGPRDGKTGRTEEGLKADAEIDKLYRAKAGKRTPPDTKTDPWSAVRAPSDPATQADAKAK